MTIHELLNLATKKIAKSKSTSPSLDVEVLLSHVLNKPKEYLLNNPAKKVAPKFEKEFLTLINHRRLGWPVAYLTKNKEFYGLKFYVDKNVLIPRPETEGLVDLVLKAIGYKKELKILDVGTGSGCIIISLAKKLKNKHLYFGSDISMAAVRVAKKNAKLHKTPVLFKHSDLLNAWQNYSFDLIIANLPYLASRSDPSTKFEPTRALIAAKKGLKLYEELFKQIACLPLSLLPSLFLEIGHDQGAQIKKLAKRILPAYETKIFKDLTLRPRFAQLVKKST